MTALSFTVPLEPPSANHYKKPVRRGATLGYYCTPEALGWYAAVAACARGRVAEGQLHAVEYRVYRGARSRGDVDNYCKVILDGLARSGVLRNDNSVAEIHGYKFRDRSNPRTEIVVRTMQEEAR